MKRSIRNYTRHNFTAKGKADKKGVKIIGVDERVRDRGERKRKRDMSIVC